VRLGVCQALSYVIAAYPDLTKDYAKEIYELLFLRLSENVSSVRESAAHSIAVLCKTTYIEDLKGMI
jgi:hypothetical protein